MEIYRKKSKLGTTDISILDIKPTQFQLYLDRIFNPETQEGIPGLIQIILEGGLILPLSKEGPKELKNRRIGEHFSDLIRLVTLEKTMPIYVMAGTHRIVALLISNWLYQTRNYLDKKEYDLANIKNLGELNRWRAEEFALQQVKGSNIGQSYKGFDIRKYQKGFDNQFTAKYGGKRVFVKTRVHSWEQLVFQNTPSMIKRFEYLLSKNLIKQQKDILIVKDIFFYFQRLS